MGALVRLLARVRPHVHSESAFMSKRRTAARMGALVRLLARVRPHVHSEFAARRKRRTAARMSARERPILTRALPPPMPRGVRR